MAGAVGRAGRGLRLAPQVEVGAPERPALHVDELRERAAREARVLDARDRLGVGRQALEVELHHVRAVADLLEVELAVRVGARVGAVVEHEAHVADPASSSCGVVHSPSTTRPTSTAQLPKNGSITRTDAVARFVLRPPSALPIALLTASPGGAPAVTSTT